MSYLKEYINKYKKINYELEDDTNKNSLLHLASGTDNISMVEYLIQNGANVNKKIIKTKRPFFAIKNNRINI